MFAGRNRDAAKKPESKKPGTYSAGYSDPSAHKQAIATADEEPNTLPAFVIDTMNIVRLTWDFMMPKDFNPTPYALSLVDGGGSSGKNFKEFCNVHDSLEDSMDLIVNGIILVDVRLSSIL